MAGRIKIPFIHDISKGRFLYLLITVLLYLIMMPLAESLVKLRFLLTIFFSATLLAAIYAVSQNRKILIISVILAVPVLGLLWANQYFQTHTLSLFNSFFTIVFLIFFIFFLLSSVFKAKHVTADVIYTAIVGYLFIGLMWAFVYSILESFFPGSFATSQSHTMQTYTYYSFVTLTTLGYGDIAPITPQARSFAILEAIIGQIYLTVLIARLVGMQISHSMRVKSD
jgi:hypothetical protein